MIVLYNQGKYSAFSYMGTRFLFIDLKTIISRSAKYNLSEFNDAFTRAQSGDSVEPCYAIFVVSVELLISLFAVMKRITQTQLLKLVSSLEILLLTISIMNSFV